MEMITDYVPATYVTHDMLHMRGGHQVEWLIDGVPIPNTNIATNLGPQIDPKDIDYLEVLRAAMTPTMATAPTGCSTSRRGPVLNAIGNAISSSARGTSIKPTTNSVAEVTRRRFAYYASLNGNRNNYGLQPPIPQVFHDAENSYGGFAYVHHQSQPPESISNSGFLPSIITRSPSILIPTQPEIRS